LPSLRHRLSDVPALATHFLKRYAAENDKTVTGFTDEALAQIASYPWPGNVRELENVIERAVVLADSEVIELRHLPAELGVTSRRSGPPPIPGATLEELERFAILKTMESVGGSTSKAAEMLGISVRKIQYKLQEYSSSQKTQTPSVAPREESDPSTQN
jgi:DNA-binding NtrC family response regulator